MFTRYSEIANKGIAPAERSVEQALEHGVICIDKPCGPSSHEVSAFVKKILNVNKTGHTGTLDPEVSGVLPVMLNQSCKAAHFLGDTNKTYVCVMHLEKPIALKDLEKAFSRFRGKIYQTPPLLSAVAKKLRVREVYGLKILEVKDSDVLFTVTSEAGFYVRNLVFDIGEILGVKSEMAELRRTKASAFVEQQAITLQELSDYYWLWKEKERDDIKKFITPIEEFVGLKHVIASDDCLHAISTGADLAIPGIVALDEKIEKGDPVGIFTGKGELVAIATALMPTKEIRFSEKGYAFDIERVIQGF
ncbi:MAG: RNA-guided pseudouridylation complex pseudouridine synthase subunit Cbf5 [Candidatus Micrarchaeota archaeon]